MGDRYEVHDRAVDEDMSVQLDGRKDPGHRCARGSAGASSPLASTSSSPVVRSAAMTRSGTSSSAKVVAGFAARITSASPRLGMRWSSRRRMFQTALERAGREVLLAGERDPDLLELVDLLEGG